MKKADAPAFAEFVTAEAKKYDRPITPQEITTWFENFSRDTLDAFRGAWQRHAEGRYGHLFPKIVDLQRALRRETENVAKTDRRCSEEIGGERCNFPGSCGLGPNADFYCGAHFRLRGTRDYTEASSMQIIDASRNFTPPKTAEECLERGAAQRAAEGARWRASHPDAPYVGAARSEVKFELPPGAPIEHDEIPPIEGEFSPEVPA